VSKDNNLNDKNNSMMNNSNINASSVSAVEKRPRVNASLNGPMNR